eukprot:1824853-Pleurochrysis_carterae.AAC.1
MYCWSILCRSEALSTGLSLVLSCAYLASIGWASRPSTSITRDASSMLPSASHISSCGERWGRGTAGGETEGARERCVRLEKARD